MSSSAQTRVCKICGAEKPLTDYPVHGANKRCHLWKCKKCFYRLRSEYNASRGEEYLQKLAQYQKQYREKNRERIAQNRRLYYEENRERLLSQKREYMGRADVRKKRREYERKYWAERQSRDQVCNTARRCRWRLHAYMQRHGGKKPCKTKDMIGCEWSELWDHLLETWKKNYGSPWDGEPYHIDHIIPLASAKTEEDVIRLFYYTNLQMLTPKDNLKKHDKLLMPKGKEK